jgi:hypothetical protein
VEETFAGFPLLGGSQKSEMSYLTARLLSAQKKHFMSRLEKCLAVFLAFFSGCSVTGSEKDYASERESCLINGKLDCILEDNREEYETKGKLIIIDFKLKNMPSRSECIGDEETEPVNFQLPAYISLAEENEKNEVHTALFFSIINYKPEIIIGTVQDFKTKKIIPKNTESVMRSSQRFHEIMKDFNDKAERFASEIKDGNFSVFQPGFDECNKCNYHRICRTVYKIDRAKLISTRKTNDGF